MEVTPAKINFLENIHQTPSGSTREAQANEKSPNHWVSEWLSDTHVSVSNSLKCQCALFALQLEL